MLTLSTPRLELVPFTADAIDALLAGDESRLSILTGATFPAPLRPPPLLEDVLPLVRTRLRQDPPRWAGGPGSPSKRLPAGSPAPAASAGHPMRTAQS